jgi:signal transduction histidine kinase
LKLLAPEALAAAWEKAREGLVIHDGQNVLYANPSAELILGIEREKILGRPLILALRDHRLEVLALQGGERLIELRNREVSVRAEAGAIFLLDQTELREQIKNLESLSQIVAHEFRTPVAGMNTLLEALQAGVSPEEETEVWELLRQEVARLYRMVEGFDLTRPTPMRAIKHEELAARIEHSLLAAYPKAAEVHWSTPHALFIDPDALHQILLNLLENAVKYAQGREIWVIQELDDQFCWLEVRDLGEAITDFEPLFVPGHRGPRAAALRGSGIGLALVRKEARSWGGEAYGRPWSRGNAFGVKLPRHLVRPGQRLTEDIK